MRFRCLNIIALFALISTGCKEHKIDKGIVVDKSMTTAYMTFVSVHSVLVPITFPANYYVTVKDKAITETFQVEEQEYASICVGDSIWF